MQLTQPHVATPQQCLYIYKFEAAKPILQLRWQKAWLPIRLGVQHYICLVRYLLHLLLKDQTHSIFHSTHVQLDKKGHMANLVVRCHWGRRFSYWDWCK